MSDEILDHPLGRDMREMLEHAHADNLLPGILAILGPACDLDNRGPAATARVPITVAMQLLQLCGPQLFRAVLTVAAPHLRVAPDVAAGPAVTAPEAAAEIAQLRPTLSPRQREILGLISEGCSNGEIGRRLWLSEETIKTHVRHVFRALKAKDRAHAVAIGIRAGLLDDAPAVDAPAGAA